MKANQKFRNSDRETQIKAKLFPTASFFRKRKALEKKPRRTRINGH